MTAVTIMASTDRREHTQPFEKLKRYLAQLRKSRLFSRCRILLFSRCHPLHSLHFCTIKGQLHQGIREYGICVIPILPRGIFDTLAFSKRVRVQGVQWGNPEKCWRISPHYLHFLHFQVPKCRKCRKCKAFTLIFLFIAPKPYGLVQSYIYWTKPKSIDGDHRKKEEPSDVGRRVPKMPKCQKCHGVKTTASHSR